MAIELLDYKKNWQRVRAAFSGGKLWGSLPPYPSRHYVDGYEAITEEAQMTNSAPKMSVFGGSNFSSKRKK